MVEYMNNTENVSKDDSNAVEEFWQDIGRPQRESENLAIKIFQEFCCESCNCMSEKDHKKEN